MKRKFYWTAVKPPMLNKTKCWVVKNLHENKISVVAEMKMLR